jgi:hypothetical protein
MSELFRSMTVLAWSAMLLGFAGSASAKPAFQELLFNPHWYRTYDSASSIIPSEGTLLYAWDFTDAEKKPDSFFVGIDTLWGMPQDLNGDTASDWDLQVCPDEICMNGLKAGIHGANSPYPFGPEKSHAEHHVQFFPAVNAKFDFTAPARSLFGAMMFCRSRSTGASDTIFAFGAWKLKWDSAFAPPVRPVAGYLPKFADFAISGDTVRYLKAGSGIRSARGGKAAARGMTVQAEGRGLRIGLPDVAAEMEVGLIGLDGRILWNSGTLAAGMTEAFWPGAAPGLSGHGPGIGIVRAVWKGGSAQSKAVWWAP